MEYCNIMNLHKIYLYDKILYVMVVEEVYVIVVEEVIDDEHSIGSSK